jgi:predicted transposase YbfD/YdcC
MRFPPAHETLDKHHGRLEQRRIWVSSQLQGYAAFPHLAQVAKIERTTRHLTSGTTRTEVAYLVTSLSAAQADAARLLALNRGHWEIENRLHWVRDVTFAEDHSQIRTGAGPRVMATLRNFAIGLLRLRHGAPWVAQALRDLAARPHRALAMVGL